MPDRIQFSPDVAAARQAGRALVALESTVLAHGLPWPDNLGLARAMEAVIRDAGAVPATIAMLDGRMQVGLTDAQLERIARAGRAAVKLSARDLGPALAAGPTLIGATTVAATMVVAARAGLRVFATGGIGGVHRGAELSGDVSADLTELGRSPVAVVSAGAKAILDLPRTLEMLETLAVPVIGWRTQEFPAFYARSSGLTLEWSAETGAQAAAMLRQHWAWGGGGALIANPIPAAAEPDPTAMEAAIVDAVAEAAREGVAGKALTPFLLARLAEVTAGGSVAANRALLLHNAAVGAEIALALAELPL